MKKLLLTVAFCVSLIFANAQDWAWLNNAGGTGPDEGWDVSMDIDHWNNTITAGFFQTPTITFGAFTLNNPAPGEDDAFLTKTDKDGTILWARNIQGDVASTIIDVSVDNFGNIYVVGDYMNGTTADFGGGVTLTQIDGQHAFLAKYDKDGNPMWATQAETKNGFGAGGSRAVLADNLGTVFWSGNVQGADTLVFDGTDLENANYPTGNDVFIVKYAPNGTIINAINTEFDSDEGHVMEFTASANIVFACSFKNAGVTIGTDVLTNPNPGTLDIAIVKITSGLNPIWARNFGGTNEDQITGISVDGVGNIYGTGGTQSTDLTFAGTLIPNPVAIGAYIVRYDIAGNEDWAVGVTSPASGGISFGTNILALTNEDIYFTAMFDFENAELGSQTAAYAGHFDSFLMRIDSAGNGIWTETLMASDSINIVDLVNDEWGNLYVAGWWKGTTLSAGTNTAFHTGAAWDVFLAKYANACNIDVTVAVNDANCGQNDGDALAVVAGGTSPYNYSWTSGDTLAFADSLTAGLYQVVVTDAFGCTGFAIAMVSDASGPNITVLGPGTNDVSCPGGSDGNIQIVITGGSTPYDINWSTGDDVTTLTNIPSGPYDVGVVDAAGCISMESVVILEPDPFDFDVTVTDASCGSADGDATVVVTGGTPGYGYSWSSGGTSSFESTLGVGNYTLTVTDNNLCVDSVMVLVNEASGPVITIDSLQVAACATGGGSVYISVAGVGPFNYSWSNGSSSEDLTGVAPGMYAVEVTDVGTGCSTMEFGPVASQLPPTQEICVVTVDSASGFNLIVWEKLMGADYIDYYNIYQEQTVAGVFNWVGSVDYDSLSQFVDSLANPLVRSYRYRMSAIDTCGVEAELSQIHQTIHLQAGLDLGGLNVNCSWNHYDGFWYGTYDVFRVSDVAGWEQLPSWASTIDSWTDLTVPVGWANLQYVISIDPPMGCTSERAEDHNSSRSNEGALGPGGGGVDVPQLGSTFRAITYPNPSAGVFHLAAISDQEQDIQIRVHSIMGELIIELSENNFVGEQEFTMDISDQADGVYLIEVITDQRIYTARLIKE